VEGLELGDGLGLVEGLELAPADVVSLGEVVSVGEVVFAGEVVSLGEVVALGESVEEGVSLGVPGICAAVRASDVAGGDAQIELDVVPAAVAAAWTAKEVKIIPKPMNAIPMTAPSAAGFSRKALTGCNPRLVRPSQVQTCRLPSTQYSWFAQRFQIFRIGHQRFMTVSSWALPPYAAGPAIRQHAHALVRRRHATDRSTARSWRLVLRCMAGRLVAGGGW
jgi:hypothetical protein